MELDELKKSWQKIGADEQLAEQELKPLFERSSVSPLVKIRKNMVRELVAFTIAILALFIILANKYYDSPDIYILGTILLLVVCALMAIFGYNIYTHTKSLSLSKTVAEQLKSNITKLEGDIKFYQLANYVLILPSFFLGLIIGYPDIRSLNDFTEISPKAWLIIIGALVILIPLFYSFVKFYTKNLYEKFILELKEMLSEIED